MEILGLFDRAGEADPLLAAVPRLLPFDPLLTGHVAYEWLRERRGPIANGAMGRRLIQYLLRLSAGLSAGAAERTVLERQSDALSKAAELMHVADSFLKEGMVDPAVRTLSGGALTSVQASNLAAALQVGAFRHYLGLRVLAEVANLL